MVSSPLSFVFGSWPPEIVQGDGAWLCRFLGAPLTVVAIEFVRQGFL